MKAISAVLLAGLAIALPALAQPAPPQAYQGLTAVAVPYANGPMRLEHVPEVWLKFPGSEARRFGMDTGSVGIVVSAEHYIPAAGDVDGGPGQLTYSSSGRVLHGTHWTTDVQIMSGRERPAATARVQVLRVDRITCLARARSCEPREHPRGVAFMGIGFARRGAQATETGAASTAPRNPFVSLSALASGAPASSVRPGYIVTRDAVYLGMTPELTRNFAFVKLQPRDASAEAGTGERLDWSAAPLTVSVDGITGTGTSLVDTGINYMFLSPPDGTALERGRAVPEGTKIAIWLPGEKAPNAAYSFTVGDFSNPLHPARVEVVRNAGIFVNTGRMFLQGFDYLYDAAGGYVGYAWTGRAGSGFGSVATGK